jgi:hypothetical protein
MQKARALVRGCPTLALPTKERAVEIRIVNRDELRAERAELYRKWNLDEREFAPVEAWRDLDEDEYCAREALADISFVLGDR